MAVLASPLAVGAAAAATTALAIDPVGTTVTMAHGSTATVNYTLTTDDGNESGTTSAGVVSGPDAGQTATCAVETGPVTNVFSGTCTFKNLEAGAGPDVLRISNGAQHADASVALTGAKSVTSSVTIDAGSRNQNLPAGSTATINVHYSPVPSAGQDAPLIYLSGLGGPDGVASPAGSLCQTRLNGTAVCGIANTPTAATQDTVAAYADNNGDTTFGAASPPDVISAPTTVTFSGAPAQVAITAPTSTATAGTCVVYTVTAVDSGGHPSAGQTVTVTMSETGTGTPSTPTATFYSSDCSSGADQRSGFTGSFTVSQSKNVVTDSNGQAKIGVAAGNPGSGSVSASFGSNVSATQPMTWTPGGFNAVTQLAVTPTSLTQYVNTTANFTVHATDGSGTPIQGVEVNRQVSGPPANLGGASCGTTKSNGNVVCTVPNTGTAGTDSVTFWVDNNSGGSHTAGPDAGEPQTTASVTFNAKPVFNSSGLTCEQQLVGAGHGTGVTSCTVSTAQKSVVFTETLKNNGVPVSGAFVDFAATSATLGGATVTGSNLPSGTATTDANGVATFTVNNPNAAGTDSVTMTAKVGADPAGTASAQWDAPVASALTLTPSVQSVTKGGPVSVTAQVTDQFGAGVAVANTLNYTVTGRNLKSASISTDSSGSATISYTDASLNALATLDTITVIDQTNPFSDTATVQYINGPTTAASVTVDSSGSGTTDSTCNASGHTPRTNVALATTTTVCILVKNSGSEVLAGKTVAVSVSNGQVAKAGGLSGTSTSSVNVTTDGKGIAFVDVKSTKSGAQTVTATVDSISGTSTVTYQAPTPDKARNIKIAPSPATIDRGAQQKFTVTVTDAYGNGVQNVNVQVTQSGPGNIGGQSSAGLTTAPDGTASVTLATAQSDSGSGSVVATISTAGTQCGQLASQGSPAAATAGNCSATATYTVKTAAVPTSLALQAAGPHKIGKQELIAATVTSSDGTPAVNQVVRFRISGANSASGSGVTSAKGVAFFAYTPTHAGTDHASAYDDVDNSSTAGAGEPTGKLSVSIGSGKKEHPRLRLTTHHGKVVMHVTSHPHLSHAKVTYYVKHLGRFHKLGKNHTGAGGKAHKAFKKRVGVKFTFRAKVSGKHGVKSGHSKAKSIRVKG